LQPGVPRRAPRDSFFKDAHSAGGVAGSTNVGRSDSNLRERDPERESEKTMPPPVTTKGGTSSKDVDGYVGFASLPNQVYRKAVKRGFEFTLMVVGRFSFVKSCFQSSTCC